MSPSQANQRATEIANTLSQQTRQLDSLSSIDEKKYVVQGAMQVIKQVTAVPQALNTTNLNSMQSAIGDIVKSKETLDILYADKDFQKNFFQIQANTLVALNNISQTVTTNELSNVSKSLRSNLVNYEAFLSPKLLEGETYSQNTSTFNFTLRKLSKTGVNNSIPDFTFNSSELNVSFPLSSATQPTMR